MPFRFPKTEALLKTALGRYGPVQSHARTQTAQIQAGSGEPLLVFAKSSTGRDGEAVRMWEDIVEPGLGSGMLVQASLPLNNLHFLFKFNKAHQHCSIWLRQITIS